MKEIEKQIRSLFNLNEEEAGIFLSGFHKIELKRNDVFIEQGKVCHKVGLIGKGLMKCVYNKNGEEIVFEFAYENNFISDYYSFVTKTPSEKQIVCLEDCEVYVISRQTLETMGGKYPFVVRMSNDINEKLFLRMHERLKSFLLHTATERYLKLISERKDLAIRIPQYLLASYLHVKPETVSRIRKKISSK